MDDKLYARFESRDESVLSEVEESLGRLTRSVARNITKSPEDAEEIASDVLWKLWDSIPPARPDSLRSFAAMIARRLSINRIESASAKKRIGGSLPLDELCEVASDGEISGRIEARELGAAINDFLSRQRAEERVIFVRRYVYAESPADIAGRLGITENSLNVKLHRLRERLRKYLKERDFID